MKLPAKSALTSITESIVMSFTICITYFHMLEFNFYFIQLGKSCYYVRILLVCYIILEAYLFVEPCLWLYYTTAVILDKVEISDKGSLDALEIKFICLHLDASRTRTKTKPPASGR